MARYPYLLFSAILLFSCSGQPKAPADNIPPPETGIPILNYSVRHTYPHDKTSFTEGFLFHNHHFFESSGAPAELPQTRSVVGIMDTLTGQMTKKIELDKQKYFGEGIVFFKDKLYQLTYKNRTGFIYDAKTNLPRYTF